MVTLRRPTFFIPILIIVLAGCPDPKKPTPRLPAKGAPGSPPKKVADPFAANPALNVTDISFAGPAGERSDASFSRGEPVLCLFTVSNFTYEERKAHIRADVRVTGPAGQTMVLQPDLKLLQGKAPTLKPGSIRTAANLFMASAAPVGKHKVELTIRDLLGKRRGVGKASFTVVGKPPATASRLTISAARPAASPRVPAGSVVPFAVEVAGFKTGQQGGQRKVDLAIEATVTSAAGKVVHTMAPEPLVRQGYHFAPATHPAMYTLPLPRDLAPGKYRVMLKVTDRLDTKATATASALLQVVPASLGVYNLHALGASRQPRRIFLLGEQVFVRLSVHGLTVRGGVVSAAVDLGVLGPHNDQHMARKDAAVTDKKTAVTAAKMGRYPVQLPLILPSLAPTGAYRLVVRVRDLHAKKTVQRELKIELQGTAPKPFGRFKVDDLEVRTRPELPPTKGDTFGTGRTYELVLKVGGVKPEELGKRRYQVRIKGGLTLRNLAGKVVHEQKDLFVFQRVMTFRPLRLLIPARWKVPADLPGGLYDLGLSAESLHDRMVTQLSRRVEIVALRK